MTWALRAARAVKQEPERQHPAISEPLEPQTPRIICRAHVCGRMSGRSGSNADSFLFRPIPARVGGKEIGSDLVPILLSSPGGVPIRFEQHLTNLAHGFHYFGFLFVFGVLSRTPRPSVSNSIPVFSSAVTIFSRVSGRPPSSPPAASRRLMVGIETPDASVSAS